MRCVCLCVFLVDEAKEADDVHHLGRDDTMDPIAHKLREAAVRCILLIFNFFRSGIFCLHYVFI